MPKSHDDSGSEGENPTHQTIKRRRKYIESNEDEDDNDNQSLEDGADDILKDCHERVTTPFVANCLKKQCYCCSKPIDKPVWRYDMIDSLFLHFVVSVFLFPYY
jgi:hypothetical protein